MPNRPPDAARWQVVLAGARDREYKGSVAQDYLIGVDLGTSVVKAGLYDTDGNLVAAATRTAPLRQPAPGVAEQDGEEFAAAAAATIGEVMSRARAAPTQVAGLACDGQMGGAMGVDQRFEPLTPWYPSGLDGRYLPHQRQLADRAGARLIELCGDLPIMAPRMLWWRQEAPERYRRIAKVVTLAGYVAGRMAGLTAEQAFVDPSYLTWIGLNDTACHRWSPELAEATGLGTDGLAKLPRIVPATAVVGHLSRQAAAQCGLAAGVPVVAGAGDQAAGFLGAGMVDEGQLIDVAGTFPVFGICVRDYFADRDTRMLKPIASPLRAGAWYSVMYINGGGLTHRWFADQFADPAHAAGGARLRGTGRRGRGAAAGRRRPPLRTPPDGPGVPQRAGHARHLGRFHLDPSAGTFLSRSAGVGGIRVCPGVSGGTRRAARPPHGHGARDRRGRRQRAVESHQGRCPGTALHAPGAAGCRHPGERHSRRACRRPAPRHGGHGPQHRAAG